MNEGALEARGVVKRYGDVVALAGVSLEVEPGECIALVGESGSGKTTLLRCFNRMVQPDEGAVLVDGEDVAGRDPIALRRSIGYVQQEGGLLPHWTVLRNAAMVPWLRGETDARDAARDALELVGLPPEDFGTRWPSELSGGQRQRVAIARALAGHPAILLMDEPFGALDAITRSELHEAFMELRERIQATCVLVTHDMGEALMLADRVVVLLDGRVEQVGAPLQLKDAPETEYVSRLLERAGV
ncbi:MAG: ATP-binding cassette domain-containing protein [Candidatus Longimicrobiales bacterium M2_2A_002]